MRALVPLVLLIAGCGARSSSFEPGVDACGASPPICIAPSTGCDAPRTADAVCDPATKRYACPGGARAYERVDDEPVCLPFRDSLQRLGGSLVRVPIGDRCLWIAEEATVGGRDVRNLGILADASAPFGTCPARAAPIGRGSIVDADPALHVQITGGYRLAGRTRVLYRAFREDPRAPFGLAHLGSGLATWDDATSRIVVPKTARFAPDLDLGDASLVEGDHAYVWGCPAAPELLTEACIVGRLDASDAMELFTGERWVASTRASDGAHAFDSGPWISSVTRRGGAFHHVFAIGFGRDLRVHVAPAVEGPWSAASSIGRCALPDDDDEAFCAGPVVHEELSDPTRPSEMVVTYGVGTTREGARDPVATWTRLVRVP